jgi:hypothetical protein
LTQDGALAENSAGAAGFTYCGSGPAGGRDVASVPARLPVTGGVRFGPAGPVVSEG